MNDFGEEVGCVFGNVGLPSGDGASLLLVSFGD
jgi:hypothetical protein